ncbi:MAG TPA: LD-carboxypeptidase [Usitatibacteraceae bacterium]|nr:LD-carboxypeptidase [Usitatibacteraceae bacterium]
MVHPRPLQAGGCIGLFAPSGVIALERHAKAVARLEALGFRVVVAEEASFFWRYFAGTDEERLAAFHRLLADPQVDALMMVRGGYGWSRLLHRVDWELVARARKPLIGFSDFTALNLAALARCNLMTFAGPGAAVDFGGIDDDARAQEGHDFTDRHCWPALRGEAIEVAPIADAAGQAPQVIEGPLWGSNLSLISDLTGTPFLPEVHGGILFLEEINEQPYAVERMLFNLFHAGILGRQKAILLGAFTDCEPDGGRFAYRMEHVIETLRALVPVPVLAGLPFGHVPAKLTIPYGAPARLVIGRDGYSLTLNAG